jgi:hypothetical protein
MKVDFPYALKGQMKDVSNILLKITKFFTSETYLQLVCGVLTDEYGLEKTGKLSPVVNVDDLLYLVHHSIAISDESFPTPRQRQQHNTLRKMMTSTSARPGTLLESSGYYRSNDALKGEISSSSWSTFPNILRARSYS